MLFEGRWALTMSMMGLGTGRLLSMLNPSVTLKAPLLMVEALLVGCIWFIHHRKETKAARLFRARSIGEEFRDDVDVT